MIGRAWVDRQGFHWADGLTWHVAYLSCHTMFDDDMVECYEVEWDSEGKCRPTGRRQMMKMGEATKSESMECVEKKCKSKVYMTAPVRVPEEGMGADQRWRCQKHRESLTMGDVT